MTQETVESKLEAGIHATSRAFSYVSGFVLFLMMIFISADVIARYLFKHAIPGSIDFIVVMMVIFVFPAFANVTRLRGHVRTDIIYDTLSTSVRGFLDSISVFLGLCFMILLSWQLGARAWNILHHLPGIATAYFQWQHWPFIIIAMVGCILMCLELIIWLIASVKNTITK